MKRKNFPQLCGDMSEASWLYYYLWYTYPCDSFVIVEIEPHLFGVHKKELAIAANWTSMRDPIPLANLHENIHKDMFKVGQGSGVRNELFDKLDSVFQLLGFATCEFLLESKFPLEQMLGEYVNHHKESES